MAYQVPPTVVSLQKFKKVEHYDVIRAALIACAHAEFSLGGSRVLPLPAGGGAQEAVEANDFTVPVADYTGFVYKVSVIARVSNAATSITPQLYNVTTTTVVWTGSAITDVTFGAPQTSSALTIVAGQTYRLRGTKSNDTNDAWMQGRIVRSHA